MSWLALLGAIVAVAVIAVAVRRYRDTSSSPGDLGGDVHEVRMADPVGRR
jgi:hypothetical protein